MTDKSILRKQYISQRKQMDVYTRADKDEKVFSSITGSKEYIECENLLCYVSTGIEVDTIRVIEYSLEGGKNVYVPKCAQKGNEMSFYKISSLKDLARGMYKILEPRDDLPAYSCSKEKTACIVPALSFNLKGMRLGYGKGYYDRFLSENKYIFSIGLCYESFLNEDLPFDNHDIPVNMIITEQRIIKAEV